MHDSPLDRGRGGVRDLHPIWAIFSADLITVDRRNNCQTNLWQMLLSVSVSGGVVCLGQCLGQPLGLTSWERRGRQEPPEREPERGAGIGIWR